MKTILVTGGTGFLGSNLCARLINEKNKIGGTPKIVYKNLPSDDPTQRNPDISLAKTNLGWEPKIKLDEGLDKTIGYFKTQINLFNQV